MQRYNFFLLFIFSLFASTLCSQNEYYQSHNFDRADTLRGQLTPERIAYDVLHYHLKVDVEPQKKYISGQVDMRFQILEPTKLIQLDLYKNMQVEKVMIDETDLPFQREGDVFFVEFPQLLRVGIQLTLRIYYNGHPTVAANPPWDGGFVWSKDKQLNDWIGVACEGDGASLWWPNKDHLSDEPDSMRIEVTVPNGLTAIANGTLIDQRAIAEGKQQFIWEVSYPINNYNVTLNIGEYVHFADTFVAQDGAKLPLDYYVLKENEAKARKHFQQVPGVLSCFENYFGKYPFWEDGYALVETPYLGMEHQGAIAYGNRYMRGYLGGMIPRDMNWDYIIVHETGHEWWGNSISCNDLSEMWIHESFTTYMEALYVECKYNKQRATEYLVSQRNYIANRQPILGPKDVNWHHWSSSDHYYKGAWMLHTLRHAIADDALFFDILRSFYDKHAIGHIHTEDFVNYVNERTNKNLTPFFNQYLRHPAMPVLKYKLKQTDDGLLVRMQWDVDEADFAIPIIVGTADKQHTIYPTTKISDTKLEGWTRDDFVLHPEWYLMRVKAM